MVVFHENTLTSLGVQWRSQNAEKVTHWHIKVRLPDQAAVFFNCVLFKMGKIHNGKNLLPEGANSFL